MSFKETRLRVVLLVLLVLKGLLDPEEQALPDLPERREVQGHRGQRVPKALPGIPALPVLPGQALQGLPEFRVTPEIQVQPAPRGLKGRKALQEPIQPLPVLQAPQALRGRVLPVLRGFRGLPAQRVRGKSRLVQRLIPSSSGRSGMYSLKQLLQQLMKQIFIRRVISK